MQIRSTIELHAGGPGSGCHGPNCGRPSTGELKPGDVGYHHPGYEQPKVIGHRQFADFHIAVEYTGGSYRYKKSKLDAKPRPPQFIPFDYGFIPGTKASDGDEVDVFLGPHEDSKTVFVVHQMKFKEPEKFDEDKVFLGFKSASEVREGYMKYAHSPHAFGGITTMSLEDFRHKVTNNGGEVHKLAAAAKTVKQARAYYASASIFSIGDPVVVDGLRGRGVITRRAGRRVRVSYRDGSNVERDQMFVHKI